MHLASWISDVLKVADYEGLKNIALNNTELDFAVFPFGSLTSISLARSCRSSWISDVLKVADYEGLKNIALNNTELDFAVFPFGSLTSISLARSCTSSKLRSIRMVSSLFFLAPMFATGSCQYPSCSSLPT
jgi:hypothetical protein